MMNFVFQMMNFVFQMMNSVSSLKRSVSRSRLAAWSSCRKVRTNLDLVSAFSTRFSATCRVSLFDTGCVLGWRCGWCALVHAHRRKALRRVSLTWQLGAEWSCSDYLTCHATLTEVSTNHAAWYVQTNSCATVCHRPWGTQAPHIPCLI